MNAKSSLAKGNKKDDQLHVFDIYINLLLQCRHHF